jgi:glycosyltransferase involved in cell wall biosynthesis
MYNIQLVSIVIPTGNEAGKINRLAKEIINVMGGTIYKYEIIIAHYGNNEQARETIYQLSDRYFCIKGLHLNNKYDKATALNAGFAFAKGDVIVAMDGDMHHDPAYMPVFLAYIERGYDVVCGLRKQQPEQFWKSSFVNLTQKIIFLFAGVNVKYLGTTYRAYRRYLPENVDRLRDTREFLNALIANKNARIIDVPITFRTQSVFAG